MPLFAVATDVPERDGAEELTALRLLYDTSRALVLARDTEAVLLRVLDATVSLLHADKGFVEMMDTDGRLRVIGHFGYTHALTGRLSALRAGGEQRGRAVIPDALSDPALAPHLSVVQEAGVRGLQSTPLYDADGDLIGIVSTQYAEPRAPRQADLALLDTLVEHAAQLVQRIWREEELRESRQRSDALLAQFAPSEEPPAGESHRRVLVVDDNEDAANMLGELLDDAGHDVRTAYTGADAIRVADDFIPDVVLLDIGLPDLDGYEVARRLRAGRASGAIIAALTGWAQPMGADQAEAAGFDVHLVKPASLQAIEDVIESVPARGRAPERSGPHAAGQTRDNQTVGLARRVMVVDDDDDIRESLMDYLEEHGYEPVGARDGLDALSKLAGLNPQPCLIILDLMMPNMDGRTFRQKQMERTALADIPVVVISAYRDVEQNARELQVANWLPKPLNLPVLLQVVRQACVDA